MKGLAAILIIIMCWTTGLLAFAARIDASTPPKEPEQAHAIVALTGTGNVRITTAVKLLEQGKGRKLLVSGVNPMASRADIKEVSRATQRLYDCCVQLGFEAADTKGNAQETAAWVKKNNYRSLIVVTADYHMPRAMLEIRGALPDVALQSYPVATGAINARGWWRTGVSARRMILEYSKYLAVFARESFFRLGPHEKEPGPV